MVSESLPSGSNGGGAVRVLHVLGTLARGGVETRLLEALKQLDPSRVRFDFCLIGASQGVYAPDARALGARLLTCRLRPGQATFLGRLARTIRRGSYDVVHSHVHQFSGVVLLAAWLAGIRGRCALLHNESDGHRSTLRRRLYRRFTRRLLASTATDIVASSEAILDSLWRSNWRADPRCRVIYVGPDTRRFRYAGVSREDRVCGVRERGGPVLIHVARFSPAKNHESLVPIAREVLARWPGARFTLVGDGPLFARIQDLIERAHLTGAFRFLGDRGDIPGLLAEADVLLLPSLWEGLPGVVMEALAVGVPVVGSPIRPIQEIARHNKGVVVADPRNPKAFAAAIDEAIHLPLVELSEEFSAEAATNALTRLYETYRS
jgi:glycosyltransferase involved in cell wall biosynthesis